MGRVIAETDPHSTLIHKQPRYRQQLHWFQTYWLRMKKRDSWQVVPADQLGWRAQSLADRFNLQASGVVQNGRCTFQGFNDSVCVSHSNQITASLPLRRRWNTYQVLATSDNSLLRVAIPGDAPVYFQPYLRELQRGLKVVIGEPVPPLPKKEEAQCEVLPPVDDSDSEPEQEQEQEQEQVNSVTTAVAEPVVEQQPARPARCAMVRANQERIIAAVLTTCLTILAAHQGLNR